MKKEIFAVIQQDECTDIGIEIMKIGSNDTEIGIDLVQGRDVISMEYASIDALIIRLQQIKIEHPLTP